MRGWSKRWPRNVYQTTSGKYAACYYDQGSAVYIGSFETVEKAIAARDDAERNAVKLRRVGHSLGEHHRDYWVLRGPSPRRQQLGAFKTQWAAERAFDKLNKDAGFNPQAVRTS